MTCRVRTALLLAFVLFLAAHDAPAQTEYNVVALDIEGNRIATKSLILGVSSIHLGSPLTQSATQETLQRLYGLGIFSDVRIEAEEATGGLRVTIVVKELPKLEGLTITGNKKIKTKAIKEKLALGVGGYISPYLIHLKRQEILDLYAEKGYFRAEVSSALEYSEDSTAASLTYSIDERSKVKVERVVMTGNVRVKANDLIKKMRNRKRGFLKSSDFAQEEYEEDLQKIVEEYHKRGFIDAHLVSDSTHINPETNRMTVYLEVYEGPLYYFGNAEFKGTDIMGEEILRAGLKFHTGETFNAETYEESLYEIYTTYQEIGHLHVRVLDEKLTRNDSIIDISYDVNEGLPSHIRLVNIVGNTKTKEKVIRRELRVFPGQVFNRSLLLRSIREVMALNYFANVEPVPVDLPSGDVDLEFKIEEKQTGQVSAGAGYNSQDKLVGSLGMGIPNLRGNGQDISFNVDFGSRRNSFNVSFTEPYLFGRPTLLGADLFLLNRRWFNDYTEGRQGGAIRLGRRLRWPDNYVRVYTSYRLERNRFYDFDDFFRKENSYKTTYMWAADSVDGEYVAARDTTIIGGAIPGSVLAYDEKWNAASRFSMTVTRDSRNLPEFATRGSVLSYTFAQTGGILGGFWEYQKHSVSVAKFIPLFWKFAVAAKVEYGVITSPAGDNRILLSDRFTPGGTTFDGIVRGYDDGSLTPDSTVTQSDTTFLYLDPNAPIGSTPDSTSFLPSFKTRVRGKYMLVTNLELQFPIAERSVYALLFFDAGNSWLQRRDIRPFTDLFAGAGFGFRLVVPGIGTIGFDFGYPLNPPPNGEEQAWKPHFQIGTTFR
ncbi:MAG TPA: outer membrane protein assembly factor BamA [Acidobacteriota bacterium]|nr:outer membrane protein assembly factor BamA [Acidobacteriota bacterium]